MKKKSCAMVVGLGLLLFSVLPCSAADTYDESELICKREYESITDIDELLLLGQGAVACDAQTNIEITITEDDNLLVRQLTGEEYYSDGFQKLEYAETSIKLYEYSDSTNSIENKAYSKSWNKYDIAAAVTANYTRYYNQAGVENGTVISRVDFRYTKGGSNYSVRKVQMYSHGLHNQLLEEKIERYQTYNYPDPNITYSLNTDDPRIYNSSPLCSFNVGAIVTLSDGTVSGDLDLMIELPELEAQW